ncbi:MAG TPA: LamG-like jellyroll fold domain-containing protein, partial [Lacipirellulaceae bacterium]|nr:LamG-like jellyroll fold domain-containing protein [Lacipirellulaceae bacterium]
VAPGTPHIVAAVMSGTTATHYLDSIADGSATISAPLGDNGDPVGLGIRSDLAQHMNGDIAEILLFSSALSDADRAAIDSYLSARYGLLLGLPPTLSILQGAPGSLELSWPTPSQPFVLESATDLSNPVWTTVANTVTDSGGVSSVTITADGQRAFYRLRKQ